MKKKDPYRPLLEKTFSHAMEFLDRLDQMPVAATASHEELYARLSRELADEGLEAGRVIDELAADTADGLLGSAGGRFFGWVIGGSVPAALAADWLTSAWDQNSAIYATSPASAVIEEVVGEWLKELLGLPADASFALVTGSQVAHVTCLAAARNFVLAQKGWDVESKGLNGAPAIRIVSSDQRHGSIARALRLLGLGNDCVADIPADEQGRLNPAEYETVMSHNSDQPTIVVLQAGDVNIGAFDPFQELIPVAHKYGAWVHVDGAFGLWAAASSAYSHLVEGMEMADSWITDGHKWLNVPYDCGYVFVAHPQAHRAAMSYWASYMTHDDMARDPMDWNPEWSRRARSIATYAAIRQLGRKGIEDMIERCCRYAEELVTRIGALPGAEMVWKSQLNQGLVRFPDLAPGADAAAHDRHTDEIIEEILKTGESFFGGTTWRGKRCMRISVSNWQTDEADVERTVVAVQRVLMKKN